MPAVYSSLLANNHRIRPSIFCPESLPRSPQLICKGCLPSWSSHAGSEVIDHFGSLRSVLGTGCCLLAFRVLDHWILLVVRVRVWVGVHGRGAVSAPVVGAGKSACGGSQCDSSLILVAMGCVLPSPSVGAVLALAPAPLVGLVVGFLDIFSASAMAWER